MNHNTSLLGKALSCKFSNLIDETLNIILNWLWLSDLRHIQPFIIDIINKPIFTSSSRTIDYQPNLFIIQHIKIFSNFFSCQKQSFDKLLHFLNFDNLVLNSKIIEKHIGIINIYSLYFIDFLYIFDINLSYFTSKWHLLLYLFVLFLFLFLEFLIFLLLYLYKWNITQTCYELFVKQRLI